MFDRKCPRCQSKDFYFRQTYKTQNNGTRRLYICRGCEGTFSETNGTPSAGLVTNLSMIAKVIHARTDGMGFNACARTFKISRNTLRDWEIKFASLKRTLYLYSLCHRFLSQTIEGDELYTKVHHNTPASESKGWTIVLMERASRFIWHMECGRKDIASCDFIHSHKDICNQVHQIAFRISKQFS
jgi:transposase-like protein